MSEKTKNGCPNRDCRDCLFFRGIGRLCANPAHDGLVEVNSPEEGCYLWSGMDSRFRGKESD